MPVTILKLRRSQPVQGQPVTVIASADDQVLGEWTMPFETWISFSKLVQVGVDGNLRSGNAIPLKIVIEGFAKDVKRKEPSQPRTLKLTNKPVDTPARATPEMMEGMQAEEDADAELQAILAGAPLDLPRAIAENLIRTLREGEKDEG